MGNKKNLPVFLPLSALELVLRHRQPIIDALSDSTPLSPAHTSQSQPPPAPVHHQTAVGLAGRQVVCWPMSAGCGDVIKLVAISSDETGKSETLPVSKLVQMWDYGSSGNYPYTPRTCRADESQDKIPIDSQTKYSGALMSAHKCGQHIP